MLAAMRRAVLAALVAGLALTGSAAAQTGEDAACGARAAPRALRREQPHGDERPARDRRGARRRGEARPDRVRDRRARRRQPGGSLDLHRRARRAPRSTVGRRRAPAGSVLAAREPGRSPHVGGPVGELARERGIRTAMLTVWPEAARSYAFPAVVRSYRAAAVAARATLLPAGSAWLAAWRRAPRLALYGTDDFHPSVLGSTLAALVVYARLTGTPPSAVPLPFNARTTPDPAPGRGRRAPLAPDGGARPPCEDRAHADREPADPPSAGSPRPTPTGWRFAAGT